MIVQDFAQLVRATCNNAVSLAEIVILIGLEQRRLIGLENRRFLARNPLPITLTSSTAALPSATYSGVFSIVETDNTFTEPSYQPKEGSIADGFEWYRESDQTIIQVRPSATPSAPRYAFVWAYTCPSATLNPTDDLWILDEYLLSTLLSSVMARIEERSEGMSVYWQQKAERDLAKWRAYCVVSPSGFEGDDRAVTPAIIM